MMHNLADFLAIAYVLGSVAALFVYSRYERRRIDRMLNPPVPDRTDELGMDLKIWCTCGHPGEHRKGCPRRPQWMESHDES